MYSTRLFQLLIVALSFLHVAHTFMIDADAIGKASFEIMERQAGGDDDEDDASATGAAVTSATATDDDATPTSSIVSVETTTSAEPSSTIFTSTTPRTTSTTPRTTSTPSSTSSDEPTSTSESSSTTSSEESSSTSKTTSVPLSTKTVVVMTTASDGSTSSYTSESVTTPTASLSSNGSDNDKGMSTKTKNTIIGVVVGVGGAIILAVGGLFAWRIWGRKKSADENDDLMGYNNGFGQPEQKSDAGGSPGNGRSPFQSTLESYHAPTQVNASSNF